MFCGSGSAALAVLAGAASRLWILLQVEESPVVVALMLVSDPIGGRRPPVVVWEVLIYVEWGADAYGLMYLVQISLTVVKMML